MRGRVIVLIVEVEQWLAGYRESTVASPQVADGGGSRRATSRTQCDAAHHSPQPTTNNMRRSGWCAHGANYSTELGVWQRAPPVSVGVLDSNLSGLLWWPSNCGPQGNSVVIGR